MTARNEVLARIRRATTPGELAVPRNYRNAEPTLASLDLLVDRLEDYHATVLRCGPGDVAGTLGGLLFGRVVVPAGFPPEWLADSTAEHLRDETLLSPRDLDSVDAVLTTCALAIAETGTVVLDGAPGQGRRVLSLVPDRHVVVVTSAQVVASVPQALQRIRPSSPQTWISGPSATSDIELERVEGVHGPRQLVVVIVGEQ